jgi:cholestanetriol 26-monooxygenase
MKFANIPFGFGVRMCYGRRLVELELHLLLVNMIRRFTLSSDQPSIRTQLKNIRKADELVRLQIQAR